MKHLIVSNPQIRRNTFETNSSSTHAVTLVDHKRTDKPFMIQGVKLILPLRSFGFGYEEVYDSPTKAVYALLQAKYANQTEEVLNLLKRKLNVYEIEFGEQSLKESYIDHDSVGILDLDKVEDFIFNSKNVLIIADDNQEYIEMQNGDYHSILSLYNGTKVRYSIVDNPKEIKYPESLDLKITNNCNLGGYCEWCHEGSDSNGRHCDVKHLIPKLDGLQPGTEIAIGGGDPTTHPRLEYLLQEIKDRNLIANLTVNGLHLLPNTKVNKSRIELLKRLQRDDLFTSLGITWNTAFKDRDVLYKTLNPFDHYVFHFVCGVHDVEDLENVFNQKILFLGYKQVGRGADYVDDQVFRKIGKTKQFVDYKLNDPYSLGICFDNLALEQLNIKGMLADDEWSSVYMGRDGEFTFYYDAVKQEYAVSSSSKDKHPINELSLVQAFQQLKIK
jgi:hypothetical protein